MSRKSATWDRLLYFLSKGMHAVDFFARKIRQLWLGSNPQSWVPEAVGGVVPNRDEIFSSICTDHHCELYGILCHW
jgi:hypothetical protein